MAVLGNYRRRLLVVVMQTCTQTCAVHLLKVLSSYSRMTGLLCPTFWLFRVYLLCVLNLRLLPRIACLYVSRIQLKLSVVIAGHVG